MLYEVLLKVANGFRLCALEEGRKPDYRSHLFGHWLRWMSAWTSHLASKFAVSKKGSFSFYSKMRSGSVFVPILKPLAGYSSG
jgi:hypothetical protein